VNVLSIVVFLPLLAALVLLALPRSSESLARLVWVATAVVELALVAALWGRAHRGPGVTGGFAYEERVRWIPSAGISYHLGLDGLSLPMLAVTAGVFAACALYALRDSERPRQLAALFLALETSCLGLFAALDLVLFFVFFDLSIVAMYFVIAGWGHGRTAQRSAQTFFLYTFLGSLALLLGLIGLAVFARPMSFDAADLARQAPLADHPVAGGLVLLPLVLGLAIKTPVVPFHTWLPPAHTDAPAVGSAVLAGVLLKMGTYGFLRIAVPILPGAWRSWAWAIVAIGVLSVVYGALVALAQTSFKRMIAYTSVNHMGYVLLAVGAAGFSPLSDEEARALAVTGAVTQMVSHGLITGALFLLAGVLYRRGGTYEMGEYGGLASQAPRFAGVTAVAAFASLGLPGFSGFVAEFQIFTGSFRAAPVAVAIALLGILITAALFLRALQRMFLGETQARWGGVADLTRSEAAGIVPLLGISVLLGLFPRFFLDQVEPTARHVVQLVSR
jgi:NADH-quinone oxidoreductase subunit M